jgi:hypothetical protein
MAFIPVICYQIRLLSGVGPITPPKADTLFTQIIYPQISQSQGKKNHHKTGNIYTLQVNLK